MCIRINLNIRLPQASSLCVLAFRSFLTKDSIGQGLVSELPLSRSRETNGLHLLEELLLVM